MQDTALEILAVFLLHRLFCRIGITKLDVGKALSAASLAILGHVNLIVIMLVTVPNHVFLCNVVIGWFRSVKETSTKILFLGSPQLQLHRLSLSGAHLEKERGGRRNDAYLFEISVRLKLGLQVRFLHAVR